MKKILLVLIGIFVFVCCTSIGVYASGIETEVTFENNTAIITGFVNGNKKPSEVSLLVGDIEDIIYIDQISSDENGNFTFKVPFDESYPKGMYPYAIGSDAGVGKFEGVMDYNGNVTWVENKFLRQI